MSTQLPALVAGLVDDAAVFPPGSASLPDAVAAHRRHRAAWYADLVGPLLLPASAVTAGELSGLVDPAEGLAIGLIGDTGLGRLPFALSFLPPLGVRARQIEAPVARRGEDPQPGLAELVKLTERLDGVSVYAEIPLTFGLMGALDALADARAGGLPVAAKFRTGGLAVELFPTPAELAAVICACRDRDLPFKLTAGLHHAVRQVDPETGFTHHGFGNVLAATLAAADGAAVDTVAELLTVRDERPLVQCTDGRHDSARPLWVGFGSCSITEPLTDLIRLGLVNGGYEA
ncbi:hypothetical protein SAMN05443287_114122 [Micromonospora phaseoli]|uniref:Uncharacterized protein n=1 Tax=Micromonospora phaseoli TaxID=1144548 RepID=A0A1H7DJG5_9ACTN|nr:hypothetical protein [Micromonospora phaseoli]PZW02401.1 hypothetical protein CLV64_102778 [Micromonospora phaseoli]GIJ75598.1 hypothetical protein Xph01_00300 [Micromonospora phaseoli]SEK01856.1 hypothetical protein SAMN05443287_114122 [Micromonospora phaseoli]